MGKEKQIYEKHELSESIYMSGHGLDRKDSDDIAEQLYHEGYRKQSEGEWELHGNDDDFGSSFFCSQCGWNIDEDEFYRSQTNDYKMYKFCPNCGAKMKGGAE